jgi:putative ABC transport system permease protein
MITIKDLSAAFYSLAKVKGYMATIIVTIGVTLGALVTMFNLNYKLLASPLPYPDHERLHILKGDLFTSGRVDLGNMYPYPAAIEAYKEDNGYFEQKGLVYFGFDVIRSLIDSPQVNTTYITPEYLQLLQAPVALGRLFNTDEGLNTNSPVAVISYAAWQQFFNGDSEVLGKTIRFGEVDFKVVGVTAADFAEPQLARPGRLTQVWLSWDYNLAIEAWRNSWRGFNPNLYLVGKLKSDAQAKQVEHELTTSINARFKEETAGFPSYKERELVFQLISYQQAILGDTKGRALLLLAGALVLLLIAAANITNLILSRAANQQRNMAIQAALGAQKFHLFNAVLAEILLLMGWAFLLSIAVSVGGIEILKRVAHEHLPRLSELDLSWESLLFGLIGTLILSLLFAFLISHQINYRSLSNMLQSSGKGAGIQISARVRRLLILSQVTLTGILLASSLQILLQSWRNIDHPLGFATDDLYQVSLNNGSQRDQPPEERKRNLLAIRDQLIAHPKVDNVSLVSDFPMNFDTAIWYSYLSTEVDFREQKQALCTLVDENYLGLLDLQLVAGRNFDAGEFHSDASLIIVNETFARKLQADGDVLNQRFYWLNSYKGRVPYEIIGIVKDISLPGRAEEPRMFIPQASVEYSKWFLKVRPGQELSNVELNDVMASVNSQYKVSSKLSLNDAHGLIVAQDKLAAGVTAGLAILALGLAAIGIYGVLSYSVQLRRYELGIRMAIGARPGTIFNQILKDNLIPVLLGLMVALFVLIGLWLWVQQSSFTLQVSMSGWIIPVLLILTLTAATSLLSVWSVISKPVISALRNDN